MERRGSIAPRRALNEWHQPTRPPRPLDPVRWRCSPSGWLCLRISSPSPPSLGCPQPAEPRALVSGGALATPPRRRRGCGAPGVASGPELRGGEHARDAAHRWPICKQSGQGSNLPLTWGSVPWHLSPLTPCSPSVPLSSASRRSRPPLACRCAVRLRWALRVLVPARHRLRLRLHQCLRHCLRLRLLQRFPSIRLRQRLRRSGDK